MAKIKRRASSCLPSQIHIANEAIRSEVIIYTSLFFLHFPQIQIANEAIRLVTVDAER